MYLALCNKLLLINTQAFLQNIFGRIDIPIMQFTTCRTFPFTNIKIFNYRIAGPTTMAKLTTRKPFIHTYQTFSTVGQLVLQHIEKHTITIIHCRSAIPEALISQRLHVQLLNTDNVISVGYPG